MAGISTEIEEVMARLAPESRRQKQAVLLRPLNLSIISISLLGLLLGPLLNSGPQSYAILGVNLLVNLLVAWLTSIGYTQWAGNLFTIWVNIGLLLLVAANLFIDNDQATALLFAVQLALTVMLAGMLMGVRYAFLLVLANVLALGVLYWCYFSAIYPSAQDLFGEVVSALVPVGSFLLLIALISWLYQRALDKADERIEVARKRIIKDELTRRDLAIARELQLRLFPPPPLVNASLQIATRSEPARETSGDFYDFIELGDDQLGIVVADVTGKSVAAALMMALARVAIRSEARRHTAPAEVLRAANETICRDHSARQMITAFYGLLDTRTLQLRFANAGHPYPILRRGDRLHEIELGGLPLGGRPGSRYEEYSVQLEPGDQLFLLSDGLIEERNDKREIYGYERLCPAILATDPTDPEMAIELLWQSVVNFRGEAEQSDDITLVVLQAMPQADLADSAPVPDLDARAHG